MAILPSTFASALPERSFRFKMTVSLVSMSHLMKTICSITVGFLCLFTDVTGVLLEGACPNNYLTGPALVLNVVVQGVI